MPDKKWVLITGASTGIGRAAAEFLAGNGFGVYACARKKGDLDALGAIENVTPVKLDVTNNDEISAAAKFVAEQGTGLYALINNAGISQDFKPMLYQNEDYVLNRFAVNALGPHNVTRAFFPMILESKGRIINVGSVTGFMVIPFQGSYCMSKHAALAYNHALRRELSPLGIKVITVLPGFTKTEIFSKIDRGDFNDPLFGERLKRMDAFSDKEIPKAITPLELVKKSIYPALTKKRPKIIYLITENNLQWRVIRILPNKILDLVYGRIL